MAASVHIPDPPSYASVKQDDEPTVLYKGKAYKDGEYFELRDEDTGMVATYGEARKGKLWVNVSKLANSVQRAWFDWYKLKGTKELIAKLEGKICSADMQSSSDDQQCSLVDVSRVRFQGDDKNVLRGTWAVIDLATAFVSDANPAFRAKWCKIMGKTYSGDHSSVADVLAETDKVAGTESVGMVHTRIAKRQPDEARDGNGHVAKIRILTDRQLARLREEKMLTVPSLIAAYASKLEAEAYVARKDADARLVQAEVERLRLRLAPPLPEAYIAFMDATAENTRTLYRSAQRGDTFVYAVHVPSTDSHQRLKFGFTSNVEKRFSDYRSLLADMNNKIVLLLPAEKPRLIERFIKTELRGCRVGDNKNTELFDVPFNKFRDVLLEVLDLFGPWGEGTANNVREALEG